MRAVLSLLLIAFLEVTQGSISDVIPGVTELLSLEELESVSGAPKASLSVIYAPWCAHSQAMQATLVQTAKILQDTPAARDKIALTKIDGNFHAKVTASLQIERYPHILLYRAGKQLESIDGYMSTATMLRMLEVDLEIDLSAPSEGGKTSLARSNIVMLRPDTLKLAVEVEGRTMMIQFLVKTDQKSRAFSEGYLAVSQAFAKEEDVLLGAFDMESSAEVQKKFGMRAEGSPYFILFKGNLDRPTFFPREGEEMPSPQELIAFVNDKAGTYRSVDGGLAKGAALVSEVDDIVRGDFSAKTLEAALSLVIAKLQTNPDSQDFTLYKRILTKITEKGPQFPEKEITRLETLIQHGKV